MRDPILGGEIGAKLSILASDLKKLPERRGEGFSTRFASYSFVNIQTHSNVSKIITLGVPSQRGGGYGIIRARNNIVAVQGRFLTSNGGSFQIEDEAILTSLAPDQFSELIFIIDELLEEI